MHPGLGGASSKRLQDRPTPPETLRGGKTHFAARARACAAPRGAVVGVAGVDEPREADGASAAIREAQAVSDMCVGPTGPTNADGGPPEETRM